jgi:hypothetical protein
VLHLPELFQGPYCDKVSCTFCVVNGVKMSIAFCLMFVYLYKAYLAAHGTQNVVDISSIDNQLGGHPQLSNHDPP